MHMHMLRRRDAAMEQIDIGDKVTGHGPLVNAPFVNTPPLHYDDRFQV